jgi:hypothetical protein
MYASFIFVSPLRNAVELWGNLRKLLIWLKSSAEKKFKNLELVFLTRTNYRSYIFWFPYLGLLRLPRNCSADALKRIQLTVWL